MIEIRKNLDLRKSFLNQDYTVKIKIADYIHSFFSFSFFVVDGSGAGYGNLEIIVNF